MTEQETEATDAVETTDTSATETTQTTTSEDQTVETQAADTETAAGETETQEAKKFNQDDVDRIVQKEKAKVERRALKAYSEKLETLSQKPETQAKPAATKSDKPTMAQFGEDVEGYVEAVAEWKLHERDKEDRQRHEQQQQESIGLKVDSLFAEAEKNPDFDRELWDNLPLTDPMAFAIMDSDVAPKLLAHFTQNPTEAARIVKLSPARQAAEIGKIEVKLQTAKPVAASKAPAPISTVGSRGGAAIIKLEDARTPEEYQTMRAKQNPKWGRR